MSCVGTRCAGVLRLHPVQPGDTRLRLSEAVAALPDSRLRRRRRPVPPAGDPDAASWREPGRVVDYWSKQKERRTDPLGRVDYGDDGENVAVSALFDDEARWRVAARAAARELAREECGSLQEPADDAECDRRARQLAAVLPGAADARMAPGLRARLALRVTTVTAALVALKRALPSLDASTVPPLLLLAGPEGAVRAVDAAATALGSPPGDDLAAALSACPALLDPSSGDVSGALEDLARLGLVDPDAPPGDARSPTTVLARHPTLLDSVLRTVHQARGYFLPVSLGLSLSIWVPPSLTPLLTRSLAPSLALCAGWQRLRRRRRRLARVRDGVRQSVLPRQRKWGRNAVSGRCVGNVTTPVEAANKERPDSRPSRHVPPGRSRSAISAATSSLDRAPPASTTRDVQGDPPGRAASSPGGSSVASWEGSRAGPTG